MTIRSEKAGTRVIDAEGRVTFTREEISVRGRVSLLSASEMNAAASFGEQWTAVAVVGPRTAVDSAGTVLVTGKGPQLDGEWKIAAIRQTPIHLRVMLRRP